LRAQESEQSCKQCRCCSPDTKGGNMVHAQ
jgi:hypothetical protein